MRFPVNQRLIFLLLIPFFLSSCKTKDPFVREAGKSSLQSAEYFINEFLNPRKPSNIDKAYERLSTSSKDKVSLIDFSTAIRDQFTQGRIIGREIDASSWEKFDLKDGRVLVYMLVKKDFHELKRVWKDYFIYRLCLGKEGEDWKIFLEANEKFTAPFLLVEGTINTLDDGRIKELKQMVRLDYEKYQFQLDMQSMESPEITLAKQCVAEGEKFYDQEEYRKALMQFQKALSIDPDNEKSRTYIARCKKAINYSMGK